MHIAQTSSVIVQSCIFNQPVSSRLVCSMVICRVVERTNSTSTVVEQSIGTQKQLSARAPPSRTYKWLVGCSSWASRRPGFIAVFVVTRRRPDNATNISTPWSLAEVRQKRQRAPCDRARSMAYCHRHSVESVTLICDWQFCESRACLSSRYQPTGKNKTAVRESHHINPQRWKQTQHRPLPTFDHVLALRLYWQSKHIYFVIGR